MLNDLTTLPAKRRQELLEDLAVEALTCRAVTVFDGNSEDGITVVLHVDSRGRGAVLDLARVVQDDPRVRGTTDWSLLPSNGRRDLFRLLLRASFERPVQCEFTVSVDVRGHPSDPLRPALPLLLAANRLAFAFDDQVETEHSLVWIDAPLAREPVLELLTAVGV